VLYDWTVRRIAWLAGGMTCCIMAAHACVPSDAPVPTPQLADMPAATPSPVAIPLTTADPAVTATLQLADMPTTTPSPVATPPATVDPTAIAAQLIPVATLDQAAEQVAAMTGTTTDTIKVRLYAPKGANFCYDCDKLPAEFAKWEAEGVPLGEVPMPLAPGSVIWLVVQGVECSYSYNGEELIPRYCQAVFSPSEQGRP